MAWSTQSLIDGYNVILYAQAAGSSAAPTTANEVPWGTKFSYDAGRQTTDSGPFMNNSTINTTTTGFKPSGSLEIAYASAVDTVRALLIAAGNGSSQIKFTLLIGGANGDKRVWDNCVLSEKGDIDPTKTATASFDWNGNAAVTYTAGTYA